MLYAEKADGTMVSPRAVTDTALCPICREPVVPKQGPILVNHFAHKDREECDPWAETEKGEWHVFWQRHVEPNRREVVCSYPEDSQKHRADMVSLSGHVIEVQHSSISVTDVAKREAFYQRVHRGMVWIVDAREFWEQIETFIPGMQDREQIGQIRYELSECGETGSVEFNWSNPRHAWFAANSEVYLDPGRLQLDGGQRMFEGALFHLLSADLGDPQRWQNYDPYDARSQTPTGEGPSGYGEFVTKNELCRRYRLKLPNDYRNADDYPSPRPNITRSEVSKGNVSWNVPPPTSL